MKKRTKRRIKRRNKSRRAGSTKPKKSLKELLQERKMIQQGYISPPPVAAPVAAPIAAPIVSPIKEQLTTFMTAPRETEFIPQSPVLKVALLIIIIDDLPLEDLWHEWLRGPNRQNVEIFIHAKYPERVRSRWVQDRLIRSNLRPAWGSIELSKAMYYLLEDALQYRSFRADYFIFLSESCIPLYNIDEFFHRLQGETKSWIDYTNKPTNGYANSIQFAPLKEVVPDACVYKSDQWVMLNRTNAIQLVEFEKNANVSMWNLISTVSKASDEMWIPTILCIINNGLENNVEKRKITYVDWGQEIRSPITFETITSELIQTAREKGSLFMRKFKSNDPRKLVDEWYRIVILNRP